VGKTEWSGFLVQGQACTQHSLRVTTTKNSDTGSNNHAQLSVSDEDEENHNVPTLVRLQNEVRVYVLSSTADHSQTLKEDKLNCWSKSKTKLAWDEK
jgi:hypothetical protein